MSIEPPTIKKIGNDLLVYVDAHGYPHWTRIEGDNIHISLGHEEARDLLYAMQRIVVYLDAKNV